MEKCANRLIIIIIYCWNIYLFKHYVKDRLIIYYLLKVNAKNGNFKAFFADQQQFRKLGMIICP